MNARKNQTNGSGLSSAVKLTAKTLPLLVCSGLVVLQARAGNDNRDPDVPAAIQAPGDTNKVAFHVYAVGVQIYTNDSTTFAWGLKAPEATLFDADGNVVGIHYAYGYTSAGAPIPAWETESGSLVVGSRIASSGGGPGNIAWLLLQAIHTEGPGVLEPTTYV